MLAQRAEWAAATAAAHDVAPRFRGCDTGTPGNAKTSTALAPKDVARQSFPYGRAKYLRHGPHGKAREGRALSVSESVHFTPAERIWA